MITPLRRDWAEWRSESVIIVSVVPTAQGIVNGGFPASGSGGLLSEVPPGPWRRLIVADTSGERVVTAGSSTSDARSFDSAFSFADREGKCCAQDDSGLVRP